MFLIPVAVVGFSIWEKKKKEEEERKQNDGPQAPETVDGPVFAESSTEEDLVVVPCDSDDSKGLKRGASSCSDTGYVTADETVSSRGSSSSPEQVPKQPDGPFAGIRRFFADQRGKDPYQIKTDEDRLKFEVMGNHGDLALNFPKISFK